MKVVIKASLLKVIYKLISLFIQGKNLINVRYARKNIQGLEDLKFIRELIRERNHSNVKYVVLNSQKTATWRHTWGFILEKSPFAVNSMDVIKISQLLDTWLIIKESIQTKDLLTVLFANKLSWEIPPWRFIWIDIKVFRMPRKN